MVKHFKILVTCFSGRVSRNAGVWTQAVTFRCSQHGALGSKRTWCAVELFIRTGWITETQRGFRRERNQQEAPSPNAIRRWVRQWREEGSVTCKKPRGRPSSVRSRSPRRSARKHAQALGMSDKSALSIVRSDLSLHPYKLQAVNALSDRDREMRLQFCRQFVRIDWKSRPAEQTSDEWWGTFSFAWHS